MIIGGEIIGRETDDHTVQSNQVAHKAPYHNAEQHHAVTIKAEITAVDDRAIVQGHTGLAIFPHAHERIPIKEALIPNRTGSTETRHSGNPIVRQSGTQHDGRNCAGHIMSNNRRPCQPHHPRYAHIVGDHGGFTRIISSRMPISTFPTITQQCHRLGVNATTAFASKASVEAPS